MNNIKSICVFCGSSQAVEDCYKSVATQLGREIGRRGADLVYGGASIGLMGCVARGVHEEKGKVIGILPEFFRKKDIEYLDADELIVTKDMRERKAKMDERSDAFIVLPGGIGTLDETFEILTWRQLRVHDKPLVILDDDGFWRPLQGMLDAIVQGGFADQGISDYFSFVSNIDGVFDALSAAPGPTGALNSETL